MMRVLQAGGLTVDTESKILDPFTAQMMREPYGMFENFQAVQRGVFVNTFKLIDHSKFSLVPSDYKFIFIGRTLAEIEASWTAISGIYNTLENASFPIDQKLAEVEAGYAAWQAILAANPSLFLKLDYDSVFAGTDLMASSIASFIDTASFNFNQSAASAAVDQTLYIKRS